jgi:hypothetical protein
MNKKLWVFLMVSFSFFQIQTVYAVERYIMSSIATNHPDNRVKNVYLLADKVDGMTYKNFTVQIGDAEAHGSLHHFADWVNIKYEPKLIVADIDRDHYEDIIVELVKGAGSGISEKEIHVLNYNGDYREVPVEPIEDAVKRMVKMDKQGEVATIHIGNVKYQFDVSTLNYHKKAFYPTPEIFPPLEHYWVKEDEGSLYGSRIVFISFPGHIGSLEVKYHWNDEMYKAQSIVFKPYIPEKR